MRNLPHWENVKTNFTLASRENQLPGRGKPTEDLASVRHRRDIYKKMRAAVPPSTAIDSVNVLRRIRRCRSSANRLCTRQPYASSASYSSDTTSLRQNPDGGLPRTLRSTHP